MPSRDLLPCALPFPDSASTPDAKACSRSVRRRSLAKAAWQTWCNDGVQSLNEVYGHPGADKVVDDAPSRGQLLCLERLREAYKVVEKPPPDLPSAAGAFKELCGTLLDTRVTSPSMGNQLPSEPGRLVTASWIDARQP